MNKSIEQFIIDNYPTMDLRSMVLHTGYSASYIHKLANANNVYKQKKSRGVAAEEGAEKVITNRRYIYHNGRWISYIRYVYEKFNAPLLKGQGLILKDKTKEITMDNITMYQKRYKDKATPSEVSFVRRVCDIVGIYYDECFMNKRKGDTPKVKEAICALHYELHGEEEKSKRQARLGAAIGRDRTMVIHYEKRHLNDYKFDSKYRKLYDKIKQEYDTKEI